MQSKSELRKLMLAKRQAIADGERTYHEQTIIRHIRILPCFVKASSIALYMPIRGEVNLLTLWQSEDRPILFPKVSGENLIFSSPASKKDFTEGAYGIPEPVSKGNTEISKIDVIFVPGVAFDRYGHRLGYGKGYYDRLIERYPDITFIGVCLDDFCIEELPVDPWDARVDFVVTQAGIYKSEVE
jgi:5-formyltetrahydrofolate cyclo-ligase